MTLIGHYSAEKIARTMTKLWRWLRGSSMLRRTAYVGCDGRNTSHFELVSQQPDLVVVVLLQLDLSLLELVDLVSNHLHLLNLIANLTLNLFRAPGLSFELRPERIEKFVEARVRSRLHPAMGIGPPYGVVHRVSA